MKAMVAASFLNILVIYVCGVVYYALLMALYVGRPAAASTLLISCAAVFIPGDAASAILSVVLAKRLRPVINR